MDLNYLIAKEIYKLVVSLVQATVKKNLFKKIKNSKTNFFYI
jgi:hypothetical protein